MARGDVTIANSGYTADLIAQRYGTSRQRIAVIHRGVDTRRFDPGARRAERVAALRARWGVDDATRVILQMARLTGWKGQSVLIEAAARLKAAGKLQGAVVVLAGDAQGRTGYVQALHAQVAQAGLEPTSASSATSRTWRRPSWPRMWRSSPRPSRRPSAGRPSRRRPWAAR